MRPDCAMRGCLSSENCCQDDETNEIASLRDEIHQLKCKLETANQKITWLTLGYDYPMFKFATAQDMQDNNARCARFGSESGKLQWRWRDPNTIPNEFNQWEAEAAILDAFVSQGGAHVWSGDGSSCAAQIVHAVWVKKQMEIDKLKS